jgi:hypothetical protein
LWRHGRVAGTPCLEGPVVLWWLDQVSEAQLCLLGRRLSRLLQLRLRLRLRRLLLRLPLRRLLRLLRLWLLAAILQGAGSCKLDRHLLQHAD